MKCRFALVTFIVISAYLAHSQCFLLPTEACVGECGPVFYLQNDPPGTTYQWTISCGTITNDTLANPHIVCFDSVGICTVQVIIQMPGEDPDTCTSEINILAPSFSDVAEEICEGDSIEINGTYYTEGTYMDTIFGAAANGCDSIIQISIIELLNDTTAIDYSGCEGDSFSIIVNNVVYDESNPVGTETLTGSNGCDSIVVISLFFNANTTGEFIYFGCQGDSFSIVINNNLYNEINTSGTEIIPNANGCDSTVNISLTFFPHVFDTVSYAGCAGDGYSVIVAGTEYNEANPEGIDTLFGGCDTIIIIDLHFDTLDATLTLDGNQLCASPPGLNYTWMNCDSTMLSDTTACITVAGEGCVCVIVDNGTCADTICETYLVCELFCEIAAPPAICAGDSFYLDVMTNAGVNAIINWSVFLDSFQVNIDAQPGTWVTLPDQGCYEIVIEINEGGCTTICSHTICTVERPLADLCCATYTCDSCAVLDVRLFGNPPWSIAISDGNTVDTVTGIFSSQYEYLACPSPNTSTLYTLLWVRDESDLCNGGLIHDTATVFIDATANASVNIVENTLCANDGAVNYVWTNCQNTLIFSIDQCFTPNVSGCYCVHTTLLSGCFDTACVDFIVTSVEHIDPSTWSVAYEKKANCIVISGDIPSERIIQVSDVMGRKLFFGNPVDKADGSTYIPVGDQATGIVMVSIFSGNFHTTRAVFVSP